MELQEAIRKRRTLHVFNNDKIPETIVHRAIEAANYAPCHKLTFPWRFTNVAEETRELLADLAVDMKFNSNLIDNVNEKKIKAKIINPSHLIVASQILSNDAKSNLEDYAACACAIQNLMLSLTADKVGSKWSTGEITTHVDTYKLFEINPLEEKIIGFIIAGYGNIPSTINRPLITTIYRQK